MTHPDFKKTGHPAIRLMEECGELIQAVAKAERFGYRDWHPETPNQSNIAKIRMEFNDVLETMKDLERWYSESAKT